MFLAKKYLMSISGEQYVRIALPDQSIDATQR
jgi:hypothetical protein